MQATASSGNSISQPTEQSRQFEGQFGFRFRTNSLACINADDADDEAAAEVDGIAFDVDAPKFTIDCFADELVDGIECDGAFD